MDVCTQLVTCTSRSITKWMLIEILYQPMQQLLAAVVVVGVVAADFPGLLVLALVEIEVIPFMYRLNRLSAIASFLFKSISTAK